MAHPRSNRTVIAKAGTLAIFMPYILGKNTATQLQRHPASSLLHYHDSDKSLFKYLYLSIQF